MIPLSVYAPPLIRQCPVCDTVVQLSVTVIYLCRGDRLDRGSVTTALPHRGPCSRLCVLSKPNDADGVLHTFRDCPACAAYADAPTEAREERP